MIDLKTFKCIVCNGEMIGDNGYGGFEFDVRCKRNPDHFRYAANIFGAYVNVGVKKFNDLYDAIEFVNTNER